MPLPTPDRKAGLIARLLSLPPDLSPYLTGILLELARVNAWEQVGDRTPVECAGAFNDIWLYDAAMIGTIFPTLGALPDNALWLDGSIVACSEYPLLAAVIEPAFIVGDNIHLPDLTGRFLYGGTVAGQVGGEETHTLTIDEMPAHSHGEHMHPPGQVTGEIPTPVPDLPVPDPFSSVGGSQPHNNMPPYFTVRYFIIAG